MATEPALIHWADILQAHATGGHELRLRKRTFYSFNEGRPEDFARKDFHDIRAALHGRNHFADGCSPRHVGNLITIAEARGFDVDRRAHYKLRSGENRNARGFRIENRTRSQQNLFGTFFGKMRDYFGGSRDGECDFKGNDAPERAGVGDSSGLGRVLSADYCDQARVDDFS